MKNETITENFIPIFFYAKKCGVTPQAIYFRAKKKLLILEKKIFKGYETFFVDIKKYPPKKLKSGRKQFFPETEKSA